MRRPLVQNPIDNDADVAVFGRAVRYGDVGSSGRSYGGLMRSVASQIHGRKKFPWDFNVAEHTLYWCWRSCVWLRKMLKI